MVLNIDKFPRKSLNPVGDQAFRATQNKGRNYERTYSGALSFMRRRYSRELADVDVAITGIPFDLATTGRSGARFGPRAIRAASVGLAELDAHYFQIDPFAHLSVVDYGDCDIDHERPLQIPQDISEHLRQIIKSGVIPISMGGDHFVSYPILQALSEFHGKGISLIHFDAHPDTWVPDDDAILNHGTMFYHAIKDGIVNPEKSIQIGIRTLVHDNMGVKIITADDAYHLGVDAIIHQIKQRVADNKCYITVDIDCLDPAFAPGTGTPVAGGLTSRELLMIIRGLTNMNIIGMDCVEVAPSYDISEITAIAAAHVMHDVLCLLALRKIANTS